MPFFCITRHQPAFSFLSRKLQCLFSWSSSMGRSRSRSGQTQTLCTALVTLPSAWPAHLTIRAQRTLTCCTLWWGNWSFDRTRCSIIDPAVQNENKLGCGKEKVLLCGRTWQVSKTDVLKVSWELLWDKQTDENNVIAKCWTLFSTRFFCHLETLSSERTNACL